MLCLNGQTFSSLTGRTSGLPYDQLSADHSLWDLQLQSGEPRVADGVGGKLRQRQHCAAHSRDVAGDSGACSRPGFHRAPSGGSRNLESNQDVVPANPDWIDVSAVSDTAAEHRSFAVA